LRAVAFAPEALACDVLITPGMRIAVVALILLGLASTRTAAAEGDDAISSFEAKPTAIYAVLGLATPVGMVGAEVEETILPNWSLSAGVGWSDSGAGQGAAMIRWMAGGLRSKVTIGLGASGGAYKSADFCISHCVAAKTGTVAWANLEAGGEHRFWSGFAFRYFAGYGRVVAGDVACGEGSPACTDHDAKDARNAGYTGIAFGGAF